MRNLLSSSFSFCLLAVAGIALAGAQTTAPNEWTWEGGSTPLACPEFTYYKEGEPPALPGWQ